ncbi:prolipoprotein diacylglyceryl transferase [candidate division WWE3 bacterium]|uniref:Phosphatidylglycerol--prolipoprotein diacylglyceryl transferase n=1 Tax=candidate division WWE3 bacterium TaxID=2053526 RepID=A0A7X9DL14_UNCKA|nr:prolipoprotein diacylglyceryl transferase [candidate division WWE3 bacterium]
MSAYGIIISLSIYLSGVLSERHAKKLGLKSDVTWDFLIVGVLGGIFGARAYHVASDWSYYITNPSEIIKIWNGGLALYGALAGGFVSIYLYAKQKNITILPYLDIIALSLPLAQALGRLGNYTNQELYGLPTQLPWKIYIAQENRLSGYESVGYFHPLFAYEIVLNLFLFISLSLMYRKQSKLVGTGYFILIYLAGYSLIRFGLEFLRIESWHVLGINMAQTLSLFVFITATSGLLKLRSKIKI